MKYYYWVFIALIAVVVVGVTIWSFGWYPVASVDGSFIYDRQVDRTALQIRNVSGELARFAADQQEASRRLTDAEIRDLALEELIEQKIIHKALLEYVDEDILSQLIADELEALRQNQRLYQAATNLYGDTFPAIEQYVLRPQAERDILASHLLLEGVEDFDGWLEERKQKTDIRKY